MIEGQEAQDPVLFCGALVEHNRVDRCIYVFVAEHDPLGSPCRSAGIEHDSRVRPFPVHQLEGWRPLGQECFKRDVATGTDNFFHHPCPLELLQFSQLFFRGKENPGTRVSDQQIHFLLFQHGGIGYRDGTRFQHAEIKAEPGC